MVLEQKQKTQVYPDPGFLGHGAAKGQEMMESGVLEYVWGPGK